MPLTFLAMYGLLMPVMALKVGYISDRHLLPVAVWGAFFAAAGLCDLTDRLRQWWPAVLGPRLAGGVSIIALVMVLGLAGACLPRTLQKIHASGAGNRAAGLWLAQQMQSGDSVQDEHVWTKFYAGRMFEEPKANADPQAKSFIVLIRSKDPRINDQVAKEEEKLRSEHGEIVFHWPLQTSDQLAKIVIYAIANGSK